MSDWMPVKDPSSGRTYYANMVTKETSWDPPPGYHGNAAPQLTFGGGSQGGLITQSEVNLYNPAAQQRGGVGAPNNNYAASARVLTGNAYGNQPMNTAYQPQGQGQGPQGSQVNMMGNGSQQNLKPSQTSNKWRKVHDDRSGRDYWYHVDTKETTWYMPPDWVEETDNNQSGSARRLSAQMAIVNMTKSEVNFQTNAWEDSEDDEDNNSESSWDENKQNQSESESDDGLQTYNANQNTYNGPTNVIEVSDDSDDSDAEQNKPGLFTEDDNDLVATEEEANKYWQIGQTKGEQYPMTTYANNYFNKPKTMFKSTPVAELLQWTGGKKGIKTSLRHMDKKLETEALQVFRNITGYMGDRQTGKGAEGHVEKLLRNALKSPEEFRDEIFCQLCKQTTNNPSQGSLMKGWHLQAICCSTFPPSEEFACYLAAFLYRHTQESSEVGEWAKYCLQALDRTMAVGQRREQPTPLEVAKIINRERIPIKVYFLNQEFKTLLVHTQTRAKEISQTLGLALKLNHAESFGLYEMEFPEAGWEEAAYAAREKMERQDKINDLVNLPSDRELEMNERVLDVIASWARSKRKKSRKFHLVFKCKIHSKAQENSYSKQGWKHSFLSAVYHVVYGYYPVDREQALNLAALQLQGYHGPQDDSFYSEGVIVNQISKFLPYTVGRTMSTSQEAEQAILQVHGMYKNLDKQDAYRKYIESLRDNELTNKFMGNLFFRCVRVSRLKRAQDAGMDDILLGISENGVIYVNPVNKEILDRYKMEEILTYGFRNNAFLFVAGTLMTQKKFHFATMLGKQMNDLLRAHIDLRVQQAELQGYNVMQ